MQVEVAAEVGELDSCGSSPCARRLELAAVLAQLRRDVVAAELLVDLLLGREGVRLAGLVVVDAVLGDVRGPAARRPSRSATLCSSSP